LGPKSRGASVGINHPGFGDTASDADAGLGDGGKTLKRKIDRIFGKGSSGFAGVVFQSTLRAAALLSADFVAIQSGSRQATFLHRASPSNKMTRSVSFPTFSTVS